MEMTYKIFDGFLADVECCQICWVLVSGEWLHITNWDNRYAEHGFLYCRCTQRVGGFTKTLIRLSAIDAVKSDAP